MERWCDRPADHDDVAQHRLLRTPPKGAINGIVLDVKHIGTYTHFWQGRTTQCVGPECEPCEKGRLPRWYGYLSLWSPKTNNVVIFEFTPPGVNAIDGYFTTHGQLRGAELTAERVGKRTNSRVSLSLRPGSYALDKLPQAPNVKAILQRIWEIKEGFGVEFHESRFDATLHEEKNRRHLDDLAAKSQPSKNGKH